MKKLAQIFVTGLAVLVPFVITIAVVVYAGYWLGIAGRFVLDHALGVQLDSPYAAGAIGTVLILLIVFVVGLLTRFSLFRSALGLFEAVLRRVPGVRAIYESVRDLLKLFGHDKSSMGRAVIYSPPNIGLEILAILTNESPAGLKPPEQEEMVAIYLPLALMLGGPLMYVPRKHVRDAGVSVERALKLCATAEVGMGSQIAAAATPAESGDDEQRDEAD